MWYGLPADFQEGVGKDPMPMRLLLMSLVPLIGLYCILEPMRIFELILSSSTLTEKAIERKTHKKTMPTSGEELRIN
ncbi:hypothetical protein ACC687_38375, partial [Rhizobium ruizarguesonis]